MPEFLGWLAIYLLCGLWSTVAYQRHPWAFVREFTRNAWLMSTVGWWIIRIIVHLDEGNPYRVRFDYLDAPVRDWLRSLGRDA
jgi:hypothetical protein